MLVEYHGCPGACRSLGVGPVSPLRYLGDRVNMDHNPPLHGSDVSRTRQWVIVGLLFSSSFINYLDRAALSVALPMISAEFGFSPLRKGLLSWSFFPSYALMQLSVGWLVDHFDVKWFYAASFALWSLSCGLTGFANSLAILISLRVLLGIGESIYLPGGTKIVSTLFAPKDRGLPSGLFDSGIRVGLALGTPLIAWLIVSYGWRRMFFLVGFLAFVWLLPWVLVFPARLRMPDARLGPSGRADSIRRRGIITFDRNLFGLCLGYFCFGYYWFLLVTWLPDYLVRVRHLPVLKAGIYASLPYWGFAINEPLGGWIADRMISLGWNETLARKGIVTVAFLSGLLLVPATFIQNVNLAIVLIIGASLVGLANGNLLVTLQSCAPPEEIGVWTGMQNFIGSIGGISSFVTGYLISRTGSYAPGFVLAAVILSLGLLAYWFIVGELTASGPT
jgi:MFS transporter, ACS family, D-galactonate transporter